MKTEAYMESLKVYGSQIKTEGFLKVEEATSYDFWLKTLKCM